MPGRNREERQDYTRKPQRGGRHSSAGGGGTTGQTQGRTARKARGDEPIPPPASG